MHHCDAARGGRVTARSIAHAMVPLRHQVHGGGRFRCVVEQGVAFNQNNGAKGSTQQVPLDGLHPVWDHKFECVAERADDAILSFHVYDR